MTQQDNTTSNGLNVEQMVQTVEALKNDPQLAQFEFRARNQWINGGENRSTIQDFYGAGAEDESRIPMVLFCLVLRDGCGPNSLVLNEAFCPRLLKHPSNFCRILFR